MNQLISSTYLEEQKRLHALGGYGERGDKWVTAVIYLMKRVKAKSVLDYGCGAGSLVKALGWYYIDAYGYDPSIPDKSNPPQPADLVICTDVMEHIEPDLLVNVLKHLYSLTKIALFVVISTRPAGKTLSDGTNAHLIIQKGKLWQRTLDPYFSAKEVWKLQEHEWTALMVPRRPSLVV